MSPSDPVRRGTLVLVVGPSGAGKDSLLDAMRRRLGGSDDVVFVRRCITRPADAGGEDHVAIDADRFETLRRQGGFLLHWQAYGLLYGIPAEYGRDLDAGRTVIANVSRMVLNDARHRLAPLCVVHITASAETLAARLDGRGREDGDEVTARLRRAVATVPVGDDVVAIPNDGALDQAADRFEAVLLGILGGRYLRTA